jgi:hypothetical protein
MGASGRRLRTLRLDHRDEQELKMIFGVGLIVIVAVLIVLAISRDR